MLLTIADAPYYEENNGYGSTTMSGQPKMTNGSMQPPPPPPPPMNMGDGQMMGDYMQHQQQLNQYGQPLPFDEETGYSSRAGEPGANRVIREIIV